MQDIIGYFHQHTGGTGPHHVQMFYHAKFPHFTPAGFGAYRIAKKGTSRTEVPTVVL